MKINELLEAPIDDFQPLNDFSKPGSFDAPDRKSLTNPAYIEKIKQKFEGIPYDFNFYFLNLPTNFIGKSKIFKSAEDDEYNDHFRGFTKAVGGIYRRNDLPMLKRNIEYQMDGHEVKELASIQVMGYSCLFLSNANPASRNKLPLTPWILVHRYLHGVSDHGRGRSSLGDSNQWGKLVGLSRRHNISPANLTMKSARMGTLDDGDTLIELVTQYIMTGKIELKGIDQPIVAEFEEAIKELMAYLKNRLVVTI